MIEIINDIRNALNNKTYLSAVALALTLPDICSQVEYNSVSSSKGNYIAWVNNHLPVDSFIPFFPGFEEQTFTGNMCYSLRCSVLHSGSTDVANPNLHVTVDRFLLTKPGYAKYYKGYRYSEEKQADGTILKVTYVGIDYLCECLCDAAEDFYNQWNDKSAFDDHVFAK